MKRTSLTLLLSTAAFADSVWLMSYGDKKVPCVKVVKDATGLGLKEAVAIVEGAPKEVKGGLSREDANALMAKFISAGGTAEIRPEAGTPAKSPATTAEGHYGVKLESFGQSKIQCIKVVREATGLGLADAKKLVESAPVIVKGNLGKEAAEALVKQLEQVGGKASALLASN